MDQLRLDMIIRRTHRSLRIDEQIAENDKRIAQMKRVLAHIDEMQLRLLAWKAAFAPTPPVE
jgi:hypothetical protein